MAEPVPASGTLGIGFIGAGRIGQLAHLANFCEIPGCTPVALAELRQELGQRAARRFAVPRLYTDHHALLADPAVDAVVVVTNRPAMPAIVLDALEAGKHVLSEKPMAHTVAQAERLAKAAEARGLCYAVGYMKRYDPGVVRAKVLLDECIGTGSLGEIVAVQANSFAGDIGVDTTGFEMTAEDRPSGLSVWPLAPDWLAPQHHRAYASFLNVHSHLLNLLRHLLPGPADPLFADLMDGRAQTVVLGYGPFRATLSLGETRSGGWFESVEIVFERGRLLLELPPPLLRGATARVTLRRGEPWNDTIVPHVPPHWSFRRQAEDFIDCALTGRSPLTSGHEGVNDLALAERIWLKDPSAHR